MKSLSIIAICFFLFICFSYAQTNKPSSYTPAISAKSNSDSVKSTLQKKSLKALTGKLASCMITKTSKVGNQISTYQFPGLKLICNDKYYILEFEEGSEFVNMGKNGEGTYEDCKFYKGTYKVTGEISNKSLTVKRIECIKNEGIYLHIVLSKGDFGKDLSE